MKRNSLFTKIAALMLCVMMVIGCLPMSAFAANITEGEMDVWEGDPVALKVNGDLDAEGNTLYDGDNTLTLYTGKAITTYTWTAKEEGYLSITMPNYAGWEYTLTNTTTNEKASSSTETDATATAKVDVNIGDAITLVVTTVNLGSNVSVERTIYAEFNYPMGSQNNPNNFTAYSHWDGGYVAYVDGNGYYTDKESSLANGNYLMTVTGEGEFTVMCGRQSVKAVNGVAKIIAQVMRMPLSFAIIDATYIDEIRFTEALGYGMVCTDLSVGTTAAPKSNTASVIDQQGYWYSWTAEKNGTLTLTMSGDKWIAVVNGNVYDDVASPVISVELAKGESVEVNIGHADGYGDITFTAAFEPVAVAKIGDQGFETVAEALNAATSDQTVTMIANSGSKESPEGTLIIKPGVTLNLGSYVLYAEYVIGMKGSFLTAQHSNQGKVTAGKLVISKDNVSLSTEAKSGSSMVTVPVWIASEGAYKFGRTVMTESKVTLATDKEAGSATLTFYASMADDLKSEIQANGNKSAGITLVVTVTYVTADGVIVSCDYEYPADLVLHAAGNGGLTCQMNGCKSRSELKFSVSLISSTGAVITSISRSY